MGWIDLVQDGERWWPLVNVINETLGFIKCCVFLTRCKPVSFSEKNYSTELAI